jgi:translation initiation factor IF-1
LDNGHVVFGFLPERQAGRLRLAVGQKVILKLSPYDLSEGRILVKTTGI